MAKYNPATAGKSAKSTIVIQGSRILLLCCFIINIAVVNLARALFWFVFNNEKSAHTLSGNDTVPLILMYEAVSNYKMRLAMVTYVKLQLHQSSAILTNFD